jgi:DNA relaxase NicK
LGTNSDAPLAVSLDWLAFTFLPHSNHWRDEVAHFLRCNFGLTGWDERGGFQGYECSASVDGAVVAWGGESQKGSVHLSLPGSCLRGCDDFSSVVEWLENWRAKLTRVDIAGDDFLGERVSFAWGVAQYQAGGFSGRGTKPFAKLITHPDDTTGNTLYVGKRENGKLARLYEKGKQLGDAMSRWCRFEVEWRAKDRVLSYDMLTRPAEYLAGAYPCASFFAGVKASVRTFKQRAVISYQRAIAIARQHAGRVVSAILEVTHGDMGAVVTALRRAGLPTRIDRTEIAALRGT